MAKSEHQFMHLGSGIPPIERLPSDDLLVSMVANRLLRQTVAALANVCDAELPVVARAIAPHVVSNFKNLWDHALQLLYEEFAAREDATAEQESRALEALDFEMPLLTSSPRPRPH